IKCVRACGWDWLRFVPRSVRSTNRQTAIMKGNARQCFKQQQRQQRQQRGVSFYIFACDVWRLILLGRLGIVCWGVGCVYVVPARNNYKAEGGGGAAGVSTTHRAFGDYY